MMEFLHNIDETNSNGSGWQTILGLVLLAGGGVILIGQLMKLSWLSLLSVVFSGLLFIYWGHRKQQSGYLIAGGILAGLGLGFIAGIWLLSASKVLFRFGIILCGLGIGFILVSALIYWLLRKFVGWPLIPAVVILSLGICFAFTPARITDFCLYLGGGIGLVFLVVGIYTRLIGLIIPGCLVVTIGPGLFLAWGNPAAHNGLAQTGVMLVCFAFGWVLITVFSRIMLEKFIWWPLIPGGILGMVGWGLYIGGNPGNAISFIGNTGSIALIIMGLYLVLLRRGIRQ